MPVLTDPVSKPCAAAVAQRLLRWYDAHRRVLPWRAPMGRAANPYHVLVSEFMLQQTGVSTVIPYFNNFIARWPDAASLANASLDEVRAAWAGLGYYRRAAFLHRAVRYLRDELGGVFPRDENALRQLPGVGPYTAAAIAAIAFDARASAMDGNVERVVSRLFAISQPLPTAKVKLRELALVLVPVRRAGDYAQAVMDLGATVCTPRNPRCEACPLAKDCAGRALGTPELFPFKTKKIKVPVRRAAVFVAYGPQGKLWLRQRDDAGLLGGMWEFPATAWHSKSEAEWPSAAVQRQAMPATLNWQLLPEPVIHVFSHFRLELRVHVGHSKTAFGHDNKDGRWLNRADLARVGLPGLTRKVLAAADAATRKKESRA